MEEYFVNLRLLHALSRAKSMFWGNLLQRNISCGKLKNLCGNLGTIIGAKLCHASFRIWTLVMLIVSCSSKTLVPKVYFSCFQYTSPSTSQGSRSCYTLRNTPSTSSMPAKIFWRLYGLNRVVGSYTDSLLSVNSC